MQPTGFNFIIDCTDDQLNKYINHFDVEAPTNLFATPELGWCLQSYLILRKRTDLPVFCSNKFRENMINLIHSEKLIDFKEKGDYFTVCIQADFPRREWAHFHLVQNRNLTGKNSSFVPFWIEPGLIGRDPNRTEVKTVAYSGQIQRNFAGSEELWKSKFEEHGIEFITVPNGSWHILDAIDVLIGIRTFDERHHDRKPASKLINAWHARIPFVGGYDSAYTQVGTAGEDYLRVKTLDEAVNAVIQLKDDPLLYKRIVANGIKKTETYNTNKYIEQWEKVLTGPVLQRFNNWCQHRNLERTIYITRLRMGLLKHRSKRFIKDLLQVK